MNSMDRNRQHMLASVQKVVTDYRNVWESLPDFMEPFQQLEAYVTQYDDYQRERLELKTSVVSVRNEHWESFATLFQQLAGFMLTKAKEKGEAETTEYLKESGSALYRRNYMQVLSRAQRILEIADDWADESDSDQLKAVHQTATEQAAPAILT